MRRTWGSPSTNIPYHLALMIPCYNCLLEAIICSICESSNSRIKQIHSSVYVVYAVQWKALLIRNQRILISKPHINTIHGQPSKDFFSCLSLSSFDMYNFLHFADSWPVGQYPLWDKRWDWSSYCWNRTQSVKLCTTELTCHPACEKWSISSQPSAWCYYRYVY